MFDRGNGHGFPPIIIDTENGNMGSKKDKKKEKKKETKKLQTKKLKKKCCGKIKKKGKCCSKCPIAIKYQKKIERMAS